MNLPTLITLVALTFSAGARANSESQTEGICIAGSEDPLLMLASTEGPMIMICIGTATTTHTLQPTHSQSVAKVEVHKAATKIVERARQTLCRSAVAQIDPESETIDGWGNDNGTLAQDPTHPELLTTTTTVSYQYRLECR